MHYLAMPHVLLVKHLQPVPLVTRVHCLGIRCDISTLSSELMLISMLCCSRRVMKAVDVATCRVKKWQPEAHAAAINALLPVADNLVASGDDEGCIKLWDPRQASEASACFNEHTDFIADFAYQVLSGPCQCKWRTAAHGQELFSSAPDSLVCFTPYMMCRKKTTAWWQQAGMAP